MQILKAFHELGKADAGIAGGKGASLGEMTQAGIPVPGGFVILAETFDAFIEHNRLESVITEELAKVDIADGKTVETASQTIRKLVDEAQIPAHIAAQVTDSYQALSSRFVAVRSSATAEDSHDASWAGELESYLYTTSDTLLQNIKNCWGSLYTPRAIFYRTEKGLRDSKVSVAVVVQTMIPAEVSGICFTVHPVTKNPSHLIIEAGWGLGEAIVGGMITPDSYIVDTTSWQIIDTYLGDQTMKVVQRSEGGTQEAAVTDLEKSREKLTKDEVIELAKLAKQIEAHYGSPQDIEWAHAAGKLWIVQSRPITTL